MRSCIKFAAIGRAVGALTVALGLHAYAAIQAPGPANIPLSVIEEFRVSGIPDDRWAALMETLGNAENASVVRDLVKAQKPFPGAKLVELLANKRLAVRLGALELLEDSAGDTFGFDAWQEDPASGPNSDALLKWKAWLDKGSATAAKTATLTSETFRTLAVEIMSGNRDRAERAMRRLDAFGLPAVAQIESFLKTRTDLEPASRAALKAAEYRVVLLQSLPKQAAALARDLALGTAEQQSTALSALAKSGVTALPVIADFLASPDPLVRETAVDAAFSAGKSHAVPLIRARLAKGTAAKSGVVGAIANALKSPPVPLGSEGEEKVESVLHAMLRGFGKHASSADDKAAIARYLEHPDENVVIGALESLGGGGSNSSRSISYGNGKRVMPEASSGPFADALGKCLADPRWRIRAAALETIGKLSESSLADKVKQLLSDSDLFVRASAIATYALISGGNMMEVLEAEFARKDDIKPVILKTIFDSRKVPADAMWELLKKAPSEVILQCLDVLDPGRDDGEGKRVVHAAQFANHPNKDVSATALRLLASRGRQSALLLDALKSNDPAIQDAVLDQLNLRPGALGATASPTTANAPAGNQKLDDLYKAFEAITPPPVKIERRGSDFPGDSDDEGAPAVNEKIASGIELRSVLLRFFKDGSPRQKFSAAKALMIDGDEAAAKYLQDWMAIFSALDRRTIAAALQAKKDWSGVAMELALRLLKDDEEDVRKTMLDAWVDRPDLYVTLLKEFVKPGAKIATEDLYDYQFDRSLASGATGVQQWAAKLLADSAAGDTHKVLAIVILSRAGGATEENIGPFFKSKSPWLRRAAYRALGFGKDGARLAAAMTDDSPLVRVVVPFLAFPAGGGWMHIFDDQSSASDSQDFGSNRFSSGGGFGAWANGGKSSAAVTPELIAALEKLSGDPSDNVRFESIFALMQLGKPVDPKPLAALIPKLDDYKGTYRIRNFLAQSYSRLGKAYAILAPLALDPDDSSSVKVFSHFGISQERAFTSFEALAAIAPAGDHAADTAIAPEPVATDNAEQTFRIVYFHKPGCRECEIVRTMLSDAARNFPKLTIEERDIGTRESALLNEALSARFGLADTLRQVTPAIFAQTGALVKADITAPRLGDFLRRAVSEKPDENWAKIGEVETVAAGQTVERRFEALSVAVVAGSGLLDGINPCAFATIIFLLSYLQIARRSPGEILAVGAAFISAVFIAYFAVGLGLSQILAKFTVLQTAGQVLNYVLAAFALVIAILSFRDAQLASRGELSGMTLQLPGFLKDRIRSVIRTGAKARRFVFAAFGAGLVISFLELACTGQVYLPTIQFMLKAGQGSALGYLLIYNIAFIIPLIIVFALAFFGLRSDALIRFQKNHTATVKVLTGMLFVILAVMLIFGHQIIAALR